VYCCQHQQGLPGVGGHVAAGAGVDQLPRQFQRASMAGKHDGAAAGLIHV
jgi:hypothetical protein